MLEKSDGIGICLDAFLVCTLSPSTVEFFLTAVDDSNNIQESAMYFYVVQHLLTGDIDGDGDVDIFDVVRVTVNYGKEYP